MLNPVSEITDKKSQYTGKCLWFKRFGPLCVGCNEPSIIRPDTPPRYQQVGFYTVGFGGKNYHVSLLLFGKRFPREMAYTAAWRKMAKGVL